MAYYKRYKTGYKSRNSGGYRRRSNSRSTYRRGRRNYTKRGRSAPKTIRIVIEQPNVNNVSRPGEGISGLVGQTVARTKKAVF